MTYYPLPEIPDKAEPPWRRFVEQVRSAILAIDKYGQPIEVHHAIYTDSAYATAGLPIQETPIYRADRDVELLYSTWTPAISNPVEHAIGIYRRQAGPADAALIQYLNAQTASTDWVALTPKRFSHTASSRLVRSGEMLTFLISDTTAVPATQTPIGLLSLYMRGATR